MAEFKQVKCIELHDANIALTTREESYSATAPVGRTEWADKPAYKINLGALGQIAEMLGMELKKSVKSLESPELENTYLIDIPIEKAHYDQTGETTGDYEIAKIECKVISPNLVDIRATTIWAKGMEEESEVVETMTYSGSFTIWWVDN